MVDAGEGERRQVSLRRQTNRSTIDRQHFVPAFTNRYWATGQKQRIRIYSRSSPDRIRVKDDGYRSWAVDTGLYTPALEDYLSLIEGDAKPVYEKLLNTVPFSELERQQWVAFLVTQVVRTPDFAAACATGTRKTVQGTEWSHLSEPRHLRRVFETVFTNNDFLTAVYRKYTALNWQILVAPDDCYFIKSDRPAFVLGRQSDGTWCLVYPLTPSKCFVVGPEPAPTELPVFVPSRDVPSEAVRLINVEAARRASSSVIGPISEGDEGLRQWLAAELGTLPPVGGVRERIWGGGLDDI